jgi:hypothetical protein
MAKLLVKYLRFMRSLLKILSPIALLAYLAMPLFGYLFRWLPADQALLRYKGETAVMVAGSYASHSTVSDEDVTTSVNRERVYILLPSVLTDPKTVVVSQQNDELYKASEEEYGFIRLLAMYALILFCVWWFWLRKPAKL